MYKLIYVSNARKLMSADELHDILEVARANNRASSVTGMLLYCDGNFLQVLEGEEQSVRTTFDRIAHDTRHDDISRILSADLPGRWTADWSMAFSHCESSEDFEEVLNLASGLAGIDDKVHGSAMARRILTGFVEHNLR